MFKTAGSDTNFLDKQASQADGRSWQGFCAAWADLTKSALDEGARAAGRRAEGRVKTASKLDPFDRGSRKAHVLMEKMASDPYVRGIYRFLGEARKRRDQDAAFEHAEKVAARHVDGEAPENEGYVLGADLLVNHEGHIEKVAWYLPEMLEKAARGEEGCGEMNESVVDATIDGYVSHEEALNTVGEPLYTNETAEQPDLTESPDGDPEPESAMDVVASYLGE